MADEIQKLREENKYECDHVNADIRTHGQDKHHPELKHHIGQLHASRESEEQVHPIIDDKPTDSTQQQLHQINK